MIKEYLNVKGSDTKKIKIETYYSKGGINYFTYKNDPRGYYISVSVVERVQKDGYVTESFSLFNNGYKQLLREVGRASKKAEQISDSIAKDCARPIIKRVCEEKGIEVEEF